MQAGIYDRFAAALVEAVAKLHVAPGTDARCTIGPLINSDAIAKVETLTADAVGKGAKVLIGGAPNPTGPLFYQPTVLGGITRDMDIVREEIFGPVAVITRCPSVEEMVRLAKAAKVVVTCSSNGQLLADFAQARELVSSGLDQIILSVDGLEESTYQIYRRGGRLENVVAAIAHLRRAREQLKQKTPRICLQFLVMKHNEHEVERVHDTARRWGADRVLIKSVQVRSPQDADRFLPLAEKYRRYTLGSGRLTVKSKKSKICDRLWTGCVIHQNGHVVGCCFDKDESALLGRLTEQPFLTIWRGEALRHFRRRVAGSCKPDICNNCTHGLDLYQ